MSPPIFWIESRIKTPDVIELMMPDQYEIHKRQTDEYHEYNKRYFERYCKYVDDNNKVNRKKLLDKMEMEDEYPRPQRVLTRSYYLIPGDICWNQLDNF